MSSNVIAIFDIGKTNKKLFLFDENYRIVFEEQTAFRQTTDDDGDACEDLGRLIVWVKDSLRRVLAGPGFNVRAVNVSAYGASFVHLDNNGSPLTPLYNYLKPFPAALSRKFYQTHGGEISFSMITASPVLGHLNSGMQLYWLKKTKPEIFSRIVHSLHLPQFIAWLISGKPYAEITSIGCHTNLWNFSQQNYHEWVFREGLEHLFPQLVPSVHTDTVVNGANTFIAGVGLHDSSAALIPYLESFSEPFVLVSTGTWCINLNPVNDQPLSIAELKQDCLCYLSYQGKAVKASRIFAGFQHEQESARITEFFQCPTGFYNTVPYNRQTIAYLKTKAQLVTPLAPGRSIFSGRDLNQFSGYAEAYHQLMLDLIGDQVQSLQLVLNGTQVKRIFVDGGFSNNKLYMQLLAEAFVDTDVFAASVPQASAIGAALAIHKTWNVKPIPENIIELKFYPPAGS